MMKHITSNLRAPALISFLLVLPFMIFDWMFNVANRQHALSPKHVLDFAVLFGLLWLLHYLCRFEDITRLTAQKACGASSQLGTADASS